MPTAAARPKRPLDAGAAGTLVVGTLAGVGELAAITAAAAAVGSVSSVASTSVDESNHDAGAGRDHGSSPGAVASAITTIRR